MRSVLLLCTEKDSSMKLHEAVYQRISTRTFQQKQLSKDDLKSINKILSTHEEMIGPFGHSFDFTFIMNDSNRINGNKIGTYGIIKNVPAYLVGVCDNNMPSIIDFGYIFEHIILELTTQEFGTCWLGGTFKRKDFNIELNDSEIIPAVSPIGYPASKRSFTEKIVRNVAKSDNRLAFNELFFDVDFNSLNIEIGTDMIDCLSMVRKAPSASNKQPWRIIVDQNNHVCHIYLARTKNYAKLLNYDIQALDIGIALAHLEIGLTHYKHNFERQTIDEHPTKDGWEYIISLTLK